MIFGGRVVGEVGAAGADEASLLRAAYNLKSDAVIPELAVAEAHAEGIGTPAPGPGTER